MAATELLVFLLHWVGCLPACLCTHLSVCLSVGTGMVHRAGNQGRMQSLDMVSDETPHSLKANTTLTPCPMTSYSSLCLNSVTQHSPLRPFSCSPAPLVGLVDAVCRGWKIYTDHMCAMRALLQRSFLFGCGVNARDRNVPHSADVEWAIVCLSRQGISFKELVACVTMQHVSRFHYVINLSKVGEGAAPRKWRNEQMNTVYNYI